jgi:hypothetical protein
MTKDDQAQTKRSGESGRQTNGSEKDGQQTKGGGHPDDRSGSD